MIQSEQLLIAGLAVNVFTLNPLNSSNRPVIALFLLHGRHGSASEIKQYAEVILERSREPEGSQDAPELVIITFV